MLNESLNIVSSGELKRFVDTLDQSQVQQLFDLLSVLKSSAKVEGKGYVTIKDFRKDYLLYLDNTFSQKYKTSVVTTFNHLSKYFGETCPIKNISIREAELFKSYLIKSAPKGIMVYLRNMKAAFNRAVEWEMIDSNPFLNIKIKKHQQEKPAILENGDLNKIIENIPDQNISEIILYSYFTGARLSEAVAAMWKNVNLETRLITIGDSEFNTKSKQQRIIPIRQNLLDILVRRFNDKHKSDKYIFPKNRNSHFTGSYISKRFKSAVKKAGLNPKLHFHSLRHTFGSELGMKGVPITVIRDLMGHSTVAVTEIYSHTNLDSLKKAIQQLDATERGAGSKVA